MPSCAVKGCRNYDAKVKKIDGISYHRFPSDPVRKEHWCRIIREQRREPYFKANKNARLCSVHFCEKNFYMSKGGLRKLKETAIPHHEIEVYKKDEPQPSTPAQGSQMEPIDVDISDLYSTVDTPNEIKLKKRIVKLEKRLSVAAKKIKALHMQNARLHRKNKSMLDNIIIKGVQPMTDASNTDESKTAH